MVLAYHEVRYFVPNLATSQDCLLGVLIFAKLLLMHQDSNYEHVGPIGFYAVNKLVLVELSHCDSQLHGIYSHMFFHVWHKMSHPEHLEAQIHSC